MNQVNLLPIEKLKLNVATADNLTQKVAALEVYLSEIDFKPVLTRARTLYKISRDVTI